MRLLQLATGPDELIDLHPYVTVVTGLDEEQRRDLATAVNGLARGVAPGPAGLLEAHGVLFDLTDEMLGVLDLGGTQLQPVVRSGDLPTRRAVSPPVRELEAKEVALAALVTRWSEAVATEARAREAVAEAVRRAPTRETLTEQPAGEAVLAPDPSAEAELATARATLRDVEAAVEAERAAETKERAEPPPGPSIPELEARVAELGRRRHELERTLMAGHPVTTDEVERALAASQEIGTVEMVVSPEALAVAEQLDAVERELGGLPDGHLSASSRLDTRAGVDAARVALIEAEQAVRTPAVERSLVDRIEVAHAGLLDAADKAQSRFGGARAERRVEEVRAVEHALLDEAGFTSYSDYMMGHSLLHVDPEKERALDDARAALGAAEEEHRRTQAQDDIELTRAALLDRRRGLLDRARELLDRPVGATGASEALRELRVEGTTIADRYRPLRDALNDSGVVVGEDDLGPDDLTGLAEAWLEEVGQAATREPAFREELSEVEVDLAVATNDLAVEAAAAATKVDPEIERADRLAAAHQAVDALAARLQRHQAAARDMESLTTALEEATEAERATIDAEVERAALAVAALEAEREQAQRAVDELRTSLSEGESTADHEGVEAPMVGEVEWYLLARLAAQRGVSLAGSLPLLLDDALQGLEESELHHLLGRLERMADAVQVIVVSEDPAVTAWAIHAGEDRAAVVYPSVA